MLNIAKIQADVTNLGPGQRFGIWVQGCPFTCKKCLSKSWIPFEVATPMDEDELANIILSTPYISGVTISGGEPMLQASKMVKLLDILKEKKPELTYICFTGFELNQLNWDEAKALIKRLDVLITGLYVDALNDNKGLRGSSNQTVNFLTDRLIDYKKLFLEDERKLDIRMQANEFFMTGMPGKDVKIMEI